MKYERIEPAVFISRPNRFIVRIEHDGLEKVCHVKNTGRCKELLIPGAQIYIQRSNNPARKTEFDLIAVKKGDRLINMDSNAPNTVFGEFLSGGGLGFIPSAIRPECSHGDSRFDFYFEHDGKKAFAEVKGVTLEQGGIARFPDAPTERGIKHLKGLIRCIDEGYEAYAVFVIQMADIHLFEANWDTHSAFGITLAEAAQKGVNVLAYACEVGRDTLIVSNKVPVSLDKNGSSCYNAKNDTNPGDINE